MQASPGSAGSHALADLPAAAAHGVLSSLGDGSPPRTGRVVSACHFPGLVETSNSTHLEKMLKELFKSHWPVFYFQILMFSDFFFFPHQISSLFREHFQMGQESEQVPASPGCRSGRVLPFLPGLGAQHFRSGLVLPLPESQPAELDASEVHSTSGNFSPSVPHHAEIMVFALKFRHLV